ncbi:coiled-coil domain-containing protein 57 isoform X1 [Scleropages formosus]|uniref:coiled-coil domain-containing protein 57 isoform X1 n=1 Tax=Scleropages formosus TaxID=113540 RepID=UPI0010FACE16|nr:coiled-coil domain-containing protein 57 isoform X1 [Scleropages formosus]XP_029102515.1 coiled-coil domain-containing protein 57 isoform X1 [Scleropages formosus]
MQDGDLERQLATKEKEYKELQSLRTQQLEGALRDAQAQLSAERARFLQLREDFQFNLRVLEERDRELERYDAVAAHLQVAESAGQAEASELRIQIDKLRQALVAEAQRREELRREHKQRLAEHRLQLERVHSVKEREIEKHREEYEALKRELERRIQEVEGELALQKQELISEFDTELKRREHEFNLRRDEMSNTILSLELKVKLLNKELEVHSQVADTLQASEELYSEAQKEIKRREWEIKDISAVKDARIKELEDKLSLMEACHIKEEEIYNRKHEELDRRVRERESALEALREVHSQQLRQSEAQSRELQVQLDTLQSDKRRMELSHADSLRVKEEQLEKLRTELETTRTGWDTYIQQVSRETVSRDVELHSHSEREAKLRAELQRYREDIERHREQLASAVKREQALEQARAQAELDWQRRCEDAQAAHFRRSEEIICSLTQARDQATAELREKERELGDMAALLRSVTMERDQALQKMQGLAGRDITGLGTASSFPSEEIERLQQQNSNLRSAIAVMRKDMESLSAQLSAGPTGPPSLPVTAEMPNPGSAEANTEYCHALEKEVRELKARSRHLEEQLEEALKAPSVLVAPGPVPSPTATLPVSADNAYLKNHICCLNETIGRLRAEKVSIAATLRKREVRVAHLESSLGQLIQQLHAKHVDSDELRFELANLRKRGAAEESGLRQRLSTVEMELEEVRREAEEYQKGSMLQNLEAVALSNQVSALKLDIASRREPIVIEETAVLRQLREENLHLRQQLVDQGSDGYSSKGHRSGDTLLHFKLRQAVRCISQLARDKQQLIEMGNRLRAQLAEAGMEAKKQLGPENRPGLCRDTLTPEMQQSHLSMLEQLQYQLTTQELQFAQREPPQKTHVIMQSRHPDSDTRDRLVDSGAGNHRTHERGCEQTRDEKENMLPELSQLGASVPLQPAACCSLDQSHPLMSSTGTDGSLQNIWQMLDKGSSPSVLVSSDSVEKGVECERPKGAKPHPRDLSPDKEVTIKGTKVPVQERKKSAKPAVKPILKAPSARKAVSVRNYNIKD